MSRVRGNKSTMSVLHSQDPMRYRVYDNKWEGADTGVYIPLVTRNIIAGMEAVQGTNFRHFTSARTREPVLASCRRLCDTTLCAPIIAKDPVHILGARYTLLFCPS